MILSFLDKLLERLSNHASHNLMAYILIKYLVQKHQRPLLRGLKLQDWVYWINFISYENTVHKKYTCTVILIEKTSDSQISKAPYSEI